MKEPNPGLTIRELGRLAGVSRTTVSLALRNDPRISVGTRRRIQEIADRQGYCGDSIVSALMSRLRVVRKNRWQDTLAFISLHEGREDWSTNIRLYYEGAKTRCAQLGYNLEVFLAKEHGKSHSRLSKVLYSRGIKGLIIAPLPTEKGQISLDWKHFSSVRLAFRMRKPEINCVTHSYYGGMCLALNHLRELGHHRIGFCTLRNQDLAAAHGPKAAYLGFQYENQNPKNPLIPPLILSRMDAQVLADWLKEYSIDAVVSNLDQVRRLIEDVGLSIPRDISFANLDLQPDQIGMAGVQQHLDQIGSLAVDHVVSLVHHNQYGVPALPQTLHVEGTWVDGGTVRDRLSEEQSRFQRGQESRVHCSL